MGKKLVIVESPAKAKTIGKILGHDFEVKSSIGHVRDLPERTLGVDLEHDFKPKYVAMPGKAKVVEELRKAAKACDEVFLAPDPDREGEAIAWHLQEVLANAAKGKPIHRVQYNEITPRAVRAAFEHPGTIDMNRVDAQQARRVLDRIVGYTVSPMLWRRIKRGLSAGRVQSVALRLVCERERQIQAFKPEAYWILGAIVRKQSDPRDPFAVRLARIDGEKADLRDGARAEATLEELRGRALRVEEVRTRTVSRRPLPPFITSTLQQAASTVCSFAPQRTMSLAQHLYEGFDLGEGGPSGLITYMRTDSVTVSRDAQEAARGFVRERYGDAFVPETPNVYRSRGGAQEAHEAIRPTDVSRTPESLARVLPAPEWKLYDLIWRRFVSSQMTPARLAQRTAVVVSQPPPAQQHTYAFTATATDIEFPGFLQVMALDVRKQREPDTGEEAEEGDEIDRLPPLVAGETLDLVDWQSDRKETKPPPRFSEAALVKALEANGVGRPSTYAAIIETLSQRDYVNREKRSLIPTELGLQVNDLLVAKLDALFDVGFTASMESSLDEIEAGHVAWTRMLGDFHERFKTWMANAREPAADTGKVRAVLGRLETVQQWAPALKSGKRTYDDQKFVASVREQLETGEKPVSERQLESLVRMALRYAPQLAGIAEEARAMGFGEVVDGEAAQPPPELVMRKFDLLRPIELGPEQRRFVDSLASQAETGRRLTPNQLGALDRILAGNARVIPDSERLFAELGVATSPEHHEPDHESPVLVGALAQVTTWREPTKRGKRVFDDSAFFASVSEQFRRKGALSPRQRMALRKLALRYREQIPDFESVASRLNLRPAAKEGEKAEAGTRNAEG